MQETDINPDTPTIALAGALLGVALEEWVKPRREMGQSWDRVSRDLHRATTGQVQVSREFLRRHFGHIQREPETETPTA
jgi:hypothetical protein